MPTLRADLVAGDCGREEIPAAHAGPQFGDGEKGGEGDGADMENALTMHVVELEALDERAVDEGGMRRGEPRIGAPDAAAGRAVDRGQRLHQEAAPFEPGAEDGAAERIEDQELDALPHLARNGVVTEAGDELGNAARVAIVAAGSVTHPRFSKGFH